MGFRILLVDDNPDDRALVERQLRQHLGDPEVEHAGTAAAFEAALAAAPFDVIITDYQLRWSDGMAVLREVKRRFPECPVIMFTGSGTEEVAVSAMKEGLDDYVTKTPKHYPRVPYAVRACVERAEQRRRLEEARQREALDKARLEIALQAAGMGTWQVDLRTGQVTYSDVVGPMFGREPGFTHAGLDDWAADIHPDDRAQALAAWQRAIAGDAPYRVEFRTIGADGVVRWLVSSGRVLRDGAMAPVLVVGGARDISHEVAIQEDLKRQREDLLKADRQKNEFLAILAHELRNPLAAAGYSVALLRRATSPAALAKATEVIERQTAHMGKLLEALLDLSRITRNRIELDLRPIDLRSVIAMGHDNVRAELEARGQQLIMPAAGEPLVVMGDEVRLTQVLTNLLHNAVKFTPASGPIEVRAWRDRDKAVIEVMDNGVGIDPARLEDVFQMFSQAHTKVHGGSPGLGVGLAVVRALVELHGGSVQAFSAGLGQGTRMRVLLPLAEAAAGAAPDSGHAAAGPKPAILLADDNVDAADVLAELLRAEGYPVRTAYDGQAALELAQHQRPAILLLDIGMPGLNGYELANRVRLLPWGEQAVVIAVTGWGENQDDNQALRAGFDARLVKPVDFNRLLGMLQRAAAGGRGAVAAPTGTSTSA
jgi:two-component system CheB/CheR fusion protein